MIAKKIALCALLLCFASKAMQAPANHQAPSLKTTIAWCGLGALVGGISHLALYNDAPQKCVHGFAIESCRGGYAEPLLAYGKQ